MQKAKIYSPIQHSNFGPPLGAVVPVTSLWTFPGKIDRRCLSCLITEWTKWKLSQWGFLSLRVNIPWGGGNSTLLASCMQHFPFPACKEKDTLLLTPKVNDTKGYITLGHSNCIICCAQTQLFTKPSTVYI